MKRFTFAMALVALLLAACGGKDEPGTQASQTPTTAPAVGPALVYATTPNCPSASCAAFDWPKERANDLWLYEINTQTHSRLTNDGATTVEILPQFPSGSSVSFVESDAEQKPGVALFELDFTPGSKPKELFRIEGGNIFRYDWHPDGGSVAFLQFNDDESSALKIWTRSDGKLRTVKTFPKLLGRGVGQTDEVSVAWSPDGKSLLVVDTFRDPPLKVTMWVLDIDGKDRAPARSGTFGRWTDPNSIIYREYAGAGGWFRLTLDSNTKTALKVPAERFGPVLSRNGFFLAVNDGASTPSVYVYDLVAGSGTKVGPGVVPIWIGPEELAVTDVRPCSAEEECGEAPPWKPTGTASRLEGDSDNAEVIFPGWTLNADVRQV